MDANWVARGRDWSEEAAAHALARKMLIKHEQPAAAAALPISRRICINLYIDTQPPRTGRLLLPTYIMPNLNARHD